MRSALLLLSLIFTLAWTPAADAQKAQDAYARIERIEVLAVGIMKDVGAPKTIKDASLTTGERFLTETKIVTKSTTIKVGADDVKFGVDFRMVGVRKGQKAKVRIVWRYPEPGIKNPSTGEAKLVDEYETEFTGNGTQSVNWNLSADYVKVPGLWLVEIWQTDRKLMSQAVTIVRR